MNKSVATATPPKRLSKIETSLRLDIPIKAVDRLIERGELKAVMIPGLRVQVLESSVDELANRMYGDDRQAG